MVDYMLGHNHVHAPPAAPAPPTTQSQQAVSFDKLSFSDVLQFADFGPKLALNQPAASAGPGGGGEDADDIDDDDDDGYFFRFQSLPATTLPQRHANHEAAGSKTTADQDGGAAGGVSESTTLVQQGDHGRAENKGAGDQQQGKSSRRKRPRTVKTSEEVESQRMTHIAVERNRRRQMNEYLRVLRSLMPGSYVQRVRFTHSALAHTFQHCHLTSIIVFFSLITFLELHINKARSFYILWKIIITSSYTILPH